VFNASITARRHFCSIILFNQSITPMVQNKHYNSVVNDVIMRMMSQWQQLAYGDTAIGDMWPQVATL